MNSGKASKEQKINPFWILILPVFIIAQGAKKSSVNAQVWAKLRLSKSRKVLVLLSTLLLVFLFLALTIFFLISQKFDLALGSFFLYYLTQIPLGRFYLFFLLNRLVKENSQGKIEPNTSYGIRKARFISGCMYGEARYSRVWESAPNNAIGIRVEPFDQELPLIGEPRITDSELDKVINDSFAVFPLNNQSPDHHLVIGQTGSGKTTLINRMVDAALKENWKVIVLDLKGDPTDITKFLNLIEDQSKIRLFPNHSFDFWKGTPSEIAERIISFFPTDSEPFYLNRNANAIHSVISRSGLPAPTSIEELLDRVKRGAIHARTASDISFFAQKERGQVIGELIANDISIYLDPIRNVEAQTPFRFHWRDDWKLGIFSLDGFEPSALKMADALLHDFASWIFSESRASAKSPILLIIDEASAFHALPRVPILSALIQRARSAQVSLVFASQSLSAFKDEKDNLLHSGAIRWLGNSTEVEEMVEAAGTRSVVESGFQFEAISYTGMVTHRSQKEFKIDPDFVKELPTFHWFVSSRGKVSSVFVPPIDWDN